MYMSLTDTEILLNQNLQHLDFKRLNEFHSNRLCVQKWNLLPHWSLGVAYSLCSCAACCPHSLRGRGLACPSIPSHHSRVLRPGAQVTRPAQLLCLPPLLCRRPGFNLHFVCATCAMPGRIFLSEQLVVENRVPLNVRSGIRLLLFTMLCQKYFEWNESLGIGYFVGPSG